PRGRPAPPPAAGGAGGGAGNIPATSGSTAPASSAPAASGPAGGGPGTGFGPTQTTGAGLTDTVYVATSVGAAARRSAGARRGARRPEDAGDEQDAAETTRTGTAFTARMKHRRRHGTATERGYRYEFLDADSEPDVDDEPGPAETTDSSGTGAGTLGFAGAAAIPGVRPAGLVSVGADADGSKTVPMMPAGWKS
ncbi:PPW family C-terminal domain-containing PPE protein, partial [Mycolicibacillus trivialis]